MAERTEKGLILSDPERTAVLLGIQQRVDPPLTQRGINTIQAILDLTTTKPDKYAATLDEWRTLHMASSGVSKEVAYTDILRTRTALRRRREENLDVINITEDPRNKRAGGVYQFPSDTVLRILQESQANAKSEEPLAPKEQVRFTNTELFRLADSLLFMMSRKDGHTIFDKYGVSFRELGRATLNKVIDNCKPDLRVDITVTLQRLKQKLDVFAEDPSRASSVIEQNDQFLKALVPYFVHFKNDLPSLKGFVIQTFVFYSWNPQFNEVDRRKVLAAVNTIYSSM